MKFIARESRRGVALIMAVAIMAVLAVVGFGFASSMKLERAATATIKNITQARMAAHGAIQLFLGTLGEDATADASGTAGPLADHFNETLYTTGVNQTLIEWGNLSVRAETESLRDEAGKMNLNAFGNLSLWYAGNFEQSKEAGDITDASKSVYHGANERFSSFEVSFEEFFYYYFQQGRLWNSSWPEGLQLAYDAGDTGSAANREARIRCANLARVICLFRYGLDGKPGQANVDDDDDNADLIVDGIDNDGDGKVDEAGEGIDEPDEYNPYKPRPDDAKDKFTSVSEFKEVIKQGSWSVNSVSVPGGVAYAGAAAAQAEEANRIYAAVEDDLTVHSYSLDIRSVCIDDPGTDGYDNDGDGFVDEGTADDPNAATILTGADGLFAQLKGGRTVYGVYDTNTRTVPENTRININEKEMDSATQAAYIYLKLSHQVTYTKSDGSTFTQALVRGFTFQNALDIVDYRDTDCLPTHVNVADVADAALLGITAGQDYYGHEGLHVTEVGRYMPNVDNPSRTTVGAPAIWAAVGGTYSATIEAGHNADQKTCELSFLKTANLKQGKYLLKMNVTVPAGGSLKITADPGGGSPKEYVIDASGIQFIGPLAVGAANGKIRLETAGTGAFTVSGIEVLLPYVEVMNMSRRSRDMTRLHIQIGGGATMAIAGIRAANDSTPSIRGFKTQPGLDYKKGYGFFVIVYDEESFERNFAEGDDSGNWGDTVNEDFPIAVMLDAFAKGLDGNQNVKLLSNATGQLVAGGVIDGFTDEAGIGQCKPFSATVLAASRLICGGNLSYGDPAYRIRPEIDASKAPSVSPGRWNRNDKQYKAGSYMGPDIFWPSTAAAFDEDQNDDCLDLVVISDAGYYHSPGEVSRLSSARLWCCTLSFYPQWSMNNGTRQPLFKELLAFVVAARAPARVNLNTASDAVMAAVMLDRQPDVAALKGCRPASSVEALCLKPAIEDLFITDALPIDDDGDNVKDEYSEREEWYRRYGNVFTLRANCFTVRVTGKVANAAGATLARYDLEALCDRGKYMNADGEPVVLLLSMKPTTDED